MIDSCQLGPWRSAALSYVWPPQQFHNGLATSIVLVSELASPQILMPRLHEPRSLLFGQRFPHLVPWQLPSSLFSLLQSPTPFVVTQVQRDLLPKVWVIESSPIHDISF